MIKFNEAETAENYTFSLGLRERINEVIDGVMKQGAEKLCLLGIGGTYASCLMTAVHMKEFSSAECIVENAAEYNATGNKRVDGRTLAIIASVSGNTPEVIVSVDKLHEAGAKVLGFISKADSDLGKKVDYLIEGDGNEQLKFLMAADRWMFNRGEYADYADFYDELDAHLADDLVDVERDADAFAADFAVKHMDDPIHYYIGAGNQWGAVYSYGMCYMEEMHWKRTKTITAADFFHGTLEVIDRDTPVTLFLGEDSQRPLAERVKAFLPKICANVTCIDTKDYELPGIDEKYRGHISFLVSHAVTNRIDANLEYADRHPMEIRRYYRRLQY